MIVKEENEKYCIIDTQILAASLPIFSQQVNFFFDRIDQASREYLLLNKVNSIPTGNIYSSP